MMRVMRNTGIPSEADTLMRLMPYRSVVRLGISSLGMLAILWGCLEFLPSIREAKYEGIANRVLAGERFKTELLDRELIGLTDLEGSKHCYAVARRSAASSATGPPSIAASLPILTYQRGKPVSPHMARRSSLAAS